MTIRNVDWMDHALCAQLGPGAADQYFFPTKGGETRTAIAMCATCPVRQECADYAAAEFTSADDSGVWGSTAGQRCETRRTA